MHKMMREDADRLVAAIKALLQFLDDRFDQLAMIPAAARSVPVHQINMRVDDRQESRVFRLGGAEYRQCLQSRALAIRAEAADRSGSKAAPAPVQIARKTAPSAAYSHRGVRRHDSSAAGAVQAPAFFRVPVRGFHATSHARQHSRRPRPPIVRQALSPVCRESRQASAAPVCFLPSVNKRSSAARRLDRIIITQPETGTCGWLWIQRASSARNGCHTASSVIGQPIYSRNS